MLKFKQFLHEATYQHFSNLSLDPNDSEHKELIDAWNISGRMNKDCDKIISIPHLKKEMEPFVDILREKRKNEEADKEAFNNKDVEIIHDDPDKTIYKTKSQKGACAVGNGTLWCTADRNEPDDIVRLYDPSREHSYVIHFKKERGNLNKIAIAGVSYSRKSSPQLRNFQDKGNSYVTDAQWDYLRDRYGLDDILGDVRRKDRDILCRYDIPESLKDTIHDIHSARRIIGHHSNVIDDTLASMLTQHKELHDELLQRPLGSELLHGLIKHGDSSIHNRLLSEHSDELQNHGMLDYLAEYGDDNIREKLSDITDPHLLSKIGLFCNEKLAKKLLDKTTHRKVLQGLKLNKRLNSLHDTIDVLINDKKKELLENYRDYVNNLRKMF